MKELLGRLGNEPPLSPGWCSTGSGVLRKLSMADLERLWLTGIPVNRTVLMV